jgi:uncharacterized membrane-anchored protein
MRRVLADGPPDSGERGYLRYLTAFQALLEGELAEAEEAYRRASRWGREPQPGLALLRLAQGEDAAAQAAIRRALDEASVLPDRARLLPAFVEIALAGGDLPAARGAADELDAARWAFRRLGAAPDLARLAALEGDGPAGAAGASPPARSRCCAWSPPAGPTGPSPTSWC